MGRRRGVFGVTSGLAAEFAHQRVRDTPISEEGIVGVAVGAAVAGLRPVVELMYFDFITLAMEPLVNQAATLVATQVMLLRALRVAEKLAEEGIEVEVIDPRTLVPLDLEAIVESVRRTNRLLICHEAVTRGGWAGEIAMAVMPEVFDYLDAPIARVGALDVPVPFSERLENAAIPNEARIEAAVRQLMIGALARATL